MVHRLLVLPLASVVVGFLVLSALGPSPAILRRGKEAQTARASTWLEQQAERLGLLEQMARLGVTRRDLKDAGRKLGIHSVDKSTLSRLVGYLGLHQSDSTMDPTDNPTPGGGIVGMSLVGVVVAGLVGAPFVFLARFTWRRLGMRRRPAPAAR